VVKVRHRRLLLMPSSSPPPPIRGRVGGVEGREASEKTWSFPSSFTPFVLPPSSWSRARQRAVISGDEGEGGKGERAKAASSASTALGARLLSLRW